MLITPEDWPAFRGQYKDAVRLGLETFMFTNSLGQKNEVEVGYAKYLLEFIDGNGYKAKGKEDGDNDKD